jgi:tRNA1Val (adenine37-N6)-methyltransferase
MSSPNFRFKHFTVWHDHCAMKVGTDGVLLGAWCPLPATNRATPYRVLDIGTGSGLIALMLAQRLMGVGHIDAIDIDADAVAQAQDNFALSPWENMLHAHHSTLQDWQAEGYDLIVSNPPYFVNSMKCDSETRTLARHSDTLDCRMFFKKSIELLADGGCISIVIPCDIMEEWNTAAIEQGLYPTRTTFIKTTPKKAPKRVLIEFCTDSNCVAAENTLVLETSPGEYSDDAKRILGDFYLKL